LKREDKAAGRRKKRQKREVESTKEAPQAQEKEGKDPEVKEHEDERLSLNTPRKSGWKGGQGYWQTRGQGRS